MNRFFQAVTVFLYIALFFITLLGGCYAQKFHDVEFIIANGAEPEAIDPYLISGTIEARITQSMFEAFFIHDPKTAEPINGLVESHSINEDGLVYKFTLRNNLVWSDGMPITTEDVLFSLRRILDPSSTSPYTWFPALFVKNGYAYNKGEVDVDALGVRAIDERRFELSLTGPLPYVLDALTHPAFTIVPKHVVEQHGENWTLPENIVSSGPFVLKEWRQQERLQVEKNPRYWDAKNVSLDSVVFLSGDNMNTNYNSYINNEVDWLIGVPQGRIDEVKLRNDYYSEPAFGTYYYSLHLQKPELRDVRIREALARAIDKKDLIENVLRQNQIPTNAYVPPLANYTPVCGLAYDVKRAQQLLAEAGYANGAGFPQLSILYNTNTGNKRIAEYIQQEWLENLGIHVTLENMEWKTFLQKRRMGDFYISSSIWFGDYLDPNTFLDLYMSDGASNNIRYANSQYDALLTEAAQTKNVPKRMSLLKEAESLIIEKDIGIIPLYYYTSSHMFNNIAWQGFYSNIVDKHQLKFIKPR